MTSSRQDLKSLIPQDENTRTSVCPFQQLVTQSAFYRSQFYNLHCRFTPCNGNVSAHCTDCWKLLEGESDGCEIKPKSYTIDNNSNECPYMFYAQLSGYASKTGCVSEEQNKKMFENDIGAYMGNICDCGGDIRMCDRFFDLEKEGPSACWNKLFASKGIIK